MSNAMFLWFVCCVKINVYVYIYVPFINVIYVIQKKLKKIDLHNCNFKIKERKKSD